MEMNKGLRGESGGGGNGSGSGRERTRVLGVPVDRVNYSSAMAIFREIMNEEGCGLIVTPNSEIILNASGDAGLKPLIEGARLIIPDGSGVLLASKIMKEPLEERLTGIDFLYRILEYLHETEKAIYLLGGKPGVAAMAAENMKAAFPALRIAGIRDGYFKKDEEGEVVAAINASGAEFLCVAMGSPKQEKFISEHEGRFTAIRAGMGVGGSLDVWAGTAKRAPLFFQRHGLEWLYRLARQPARIGRAAKLPVFIARVILSRKQGQVSRARPPRGGFGGGAE